MYNSIIKKEWIKSRLCIILGFAIILSITIYSLLRIGKVIRVRGVEHVWGLMLERDITFVESIQYIPLLIGIALAFAQWVAEMQMKRLRLSLHLPVTNFKIISLMILYGIVILTIIYTIILSIVSGYLSSIVAKELIFRVLLTVAPWFIAGYLSYIITATIIIEPLWRRKIAYFLIMVGLCRICFASSIAEAYTPILPIMLLFIIIISFLPHLSVGRFKSGL